ncbi:transposable element Tc1 transposase [Trichonephila clavipes]|nr:transposable element Tc1 transposase [Trichonephila clavipes]
MPPRRKRVKFQQFTEFKRGRIIILRKGGFFCCAIAVRVQRNCSTVIRISKQLTNDHQTTRETGSGPRKVASARVDRHLIRMAVK